MMARKDPEHGEADDLNQSEEVNSSQRDVAQEGEVRLVFGGIISSLMHPLTNLENRSEEDGDSGQDEDQDPSQPLLSTDTQTPVDVSDGDDGGRHVPGRPRKEHTAIRTPTQNRSSLGVSKPINMSRPTKDMMDMKMEKSLISFLS
ncbi:hypothetical protein F7725_015045 [Dissostichus mawsoni]|uniref:Uncharacterized protein n=1 Tax=Dissostichus mawsoni TaxID=36200 RepID=A0A7J5YJS8_DISMA|nr:hypothetical protein F7725_015045 [Dissostichus mawsoni]